MFNVYSFRLISSSFYKVLWQNIWPPGHRDAKMNINQGQGRGAAESFGAILKTYILFLVLVIE
jgi:hypothetical protein